MDKLILTNIDGTTLEVEIVATFKIQELGDSDYVIYKDNNKYFGARYEETNGTVDLITDLSDNEKKLLNEVFDKLCEGEII